ncbi:MAG: nuclear transport factor 2 family protein [Myxococcota bacterium]
MASLAVAEGVLRTERWSEQERANVETIRSFVQLLMNEHAVDQVLAKYGNGAYRQHNRNIPDGMDGITSYMRTFTARFPEFSYEVMKVLADGDYVTFHSHATLKKSHRGNDKKGLNIVDTWRLEDGKIVEHWDAIQALDVSMRMFALFNGGKIRNANGVF